MKTRTIRRELNKILLGVDNQTAAKLKPIVEDAAFLSGELEKMRDALQENGWTKGYTNGKDKGVVVSPTAKAYIQAQKAFNSDMRVIMQILDKADTTGAESEKPKNGLLRILEESMKREA